MALELSELPEQDLVKLTPGQRLYLDGRIAGLGSKAAARAAGFTESQSCTDLERHPRISRLLLQATKEAFGQLVITRNDVLQGLKDAVDTAATSTELVMAWREIGKMIGAYEPEVKVHKHVHMTAEQVRNMKDDDLLAMAEEEEDFRLPAPIEGEWEEVPDGK